MGEGGQEGGDVGRLMLQQQISHLLFTQGDYQGALSQAQTVYDGICRSIGEQTGEAVLFGLRLGIYEAGRCGGGVGVGWSAYRGVHRLPFSRNPQLEVGVSGRPSSAPCGACTRL